MGVGRGDTYVLVMRTILMQNMDCSKFGVLLSLYTGIRIGELCALQWEDICLSQSTLKVEKTMQRIQVIESDFHDIGLAIKRAREASGMTQEQLAYRLVC